LNVAEEKLVVCAEAVVDAEHYEVDILPNVERDRDKYTTSSTICALRWRPPMPALAYYWINLAAIWFAAGAALALGAIQAATTHR